jgi:hypothetical protein
MPQRKRYNILPELSVRDILLGASTVWISLLASFQLPFMVEKSTAEPEKNNSANSSFDAKDPSLVPRANSGYAWIAKFNGATATPKPTWVEQFGGTSLPTPRGAATDAAGNVFLTGDVYGSLASPSKGGRDAWVTKLNAAGSLIWKRQLGTNQDDDAFSAATNADGSVIIAGATEGDLVGSSQGDDDIFVVKYTAAGKLLWKKQLGTSAADIAYGLATDSSGNVYITGLGFPGSGTTAYAAKLSPAGKLLWVTRLSGTPTGVAVDANGNSFVSNRVNGSGEDAQVIKINSAGTVSWTRQLGSSSNDTPRGITTDAKGNIYVSGSTFGNLSGANKGNEDAWVAKYSTSGKLSWVKQLGTSTQDRAYGVATDSDGNAFIAGWTSGSLGGSHQGLVDAWVSKYSPNGVLKWSKQIGSTNNDLTFAVATDSNDNVLISGATAGILPKP